MDNKELVLRIGDISILFEDINYYVRDIFIKLYEIKEYEILRYLDRLNTEKLHNLYFKLLYHYISNLSVTKPDLLTMKKELSIIRDKRNEIIHSLKIDSKELLHMIKEYNLGKPIVDDKNVKSDIVFSSVCESFVIINRDDVKQYTDVMLDDFKKEMFDMNLKIRNFSKLLIDAKLKTNFKDFFIFAKGI